MRFDPNDKKFFFNEEMTLTPAGDENLRARIREYRSEVIDHPGRFLQSKKQNNSQFEIIRNIAAGVILALSVFGLIWTVPDKRYDISGWIVTGLAVMFALILLIFPEKGASKYFTESVLSQRIQGVILMIGAALCGYVQLSMSSEGTRSVKMRWFIL